jgi:hypothetical protein
MERQQKAESRVGASLVEEVVQVLPFYAPVCLPFGSYISSLEPFFPDPLIDSFSIDLKLLCYLLYSKYFCHRVPSFPLKGVVVEIIARGREFVYLSLDFSSIWSYTPMK